jgi:hypothetical protein
VPDLRTRLAEAGQQRDAAIADADRLRAEVERLKAEAAKVAEAQQALVEAGRERDQLADDKSQLQAEVGRLKEEATKTAEAHQAELLRLKEEHKKAAAAKDGKLKAAVDGRAELEKALEARDRAGNLERQGMLLEAQHLDEVFASKCLLTSPGCEAGFVFCC